MRLPWAAMLEAQLVNPINKFRGFKELSLHILKFSRRLIEAIVDALEDSPDERGIRDWGLGSGIFTQHFQVRRL